MKKTNEREGTRRLNRFSATVLIAKAVERVTISKLLEDLSWKVKAPALPDSHVVLDESTPIPDLLLVDPVFFEDIPGKIRDFIHDEKKLQLCVIVLDQDEDARPWLSMGFDDSIKPSSFRAELEARIRLYGRIIRQAQQASDHSHKLWHITFDTFAQPIMIVDRNFNIRSANSAQCQLLDTSTERLRNKKCWQAFEPYRKSFHDGCPLKKIKDRKITHEESFETHINDKDYLVSCMPVFDTRGELESVIHLANDITEKKMSEQRLQQVDKMEALGRLAGSVAHDFNNLLMIIQSHADFLYRRISPTDPIMADIEPIKVAASRSAALTEQLLAFSRTSPVETKTAQPTSCIKDLTPLLNTLCGENIRLQTKVPQQLPPVDCDKIQLEQIIMNLVVNAKDAIDTQGEITLEALFHDGHKPRVEIRVADTGCGMDDKTKARVLEPFFTTKPPGKGTGLGLSTVHNIVRQHGGSLDINTAPGKGTSISVIFNVSKTSGQTTQQDKSLSQKNGAVQMGRGQTILVVEDERSVLRLIGRLLSSLGYQVIEAHDASYALQQAGRLNSPIHLLLTDMAMPGMNGVELAREMETKYPDTAILFMSGCVQEDLLKMGMDLARHKLLPKPISRVTLAREVAQALAAKTKISHDSHKIPRVFIVDDDELILKAFARTLQRDCHVTAYTDLDKLTDDLKTGQLPHVILCDLHLDRKTPREIMSWLDTLDDAVRSRMVFTTGGICDMDEQKAVDDSNIPVLFKPINRKTMLRKIFEIAGNHA